MKVYALRHQIRGNDTSFYSPLTEMGKFLADNKTKPILNNLGITQIYSSPFYRTLETIEPYINQANSKNVNLEYSLYEYLHPMLFNKYNYLNKLDEKYYQKFKINPYYQSYMPMNALKFPESDEDIRKRVRMFLRMLIQKYKNTNEVILLVSHMKIIEALMAEVKLQSREINMGDLVRII